MNHSTPGLPVHRQYLEFTQTHVHWVGDAIQPSHPLSSPSPPAPNPSQHQGLFQWVNSLNEVAKVLEFPLLPAFKVCVCVCVLICFSHVRLCNPVDLASQAPLSMGFSRQEYWHGLPFPSPGDVPNPGIEPRSPVLQAVSLPSEPLGKQPLVL